MKTCGNCENFTRIKSFHSGRNGLCEVDDTGTHSDNTVVTLKCKSHRSIKYSRKGQAFKGGDYEF